MFAAAYLAEGSADARDTAQDAFINQNTRKVFRIETPANGAHYPYQDADIHIGFIVNNNDISLIYKPMVDTAGGYTRVTILTRAQDATRAELEYRDNWVGHGAQIAGNQYYVASAAAGGAPPLTPPKADLKINNSQNDEAHAIIGLGPTLDRLYEVQFISHPDTDNTTNRYLLQVYKRS